MFIVYVNCLCLLSVFIVCFIVYIYCLLYCLYLLSKFIVYVNCLCLLSVFIVCFIVCFIVFFIVYVYCLCLLFVFIVYSYDQCYDRCSRYSRLYLQTKKV